MRQLVDSLAAVADRAASPRQGRSRSARLVLSLKVRRGRQSKTHSNDVRNDIGLGAVKYAESTVRDREHDIFQRMLEIQNAFEDAAFEDVRTDAFTWPGGGITGFLRVDDGFEIDQIWVLFDAPDPSYSRAACRCR